MYWQQEARVDKKDRSTVFCGMGLETSRDVAHKTDNEFSLLYENLYKIFLNEIRPPSGIVLFGIAGAKDIWQPVDSCFGQILKSKVN